VISALHLFLDRPLRGEAGAGFGVGQAVARHDAADLFLRIARGHDDFVEIVVVAGLEH
jgi:hypothetical protein